MEETFHHGIVPAITLRRKSPHPRRPGRTAP